VVLLLAALQGLLVVVLVLCPRAAGGRRAFCGAAGARFMATAPAMANALLTMPAVAHTSAAQRHLVVCGSALALARVAGDLLAVVSARGLGDASMQPAGGPAFQRDLVHFVQHSLALHAAAVHRFARGSCSGIPADAAAAAGGGSCAGGSSGDRLAVPAYHAALLAELPMAEALLQPGSDVARQLLKAELVGPLLNTAAVLLACDGERHGSREQLVRSATPEGLVALLQVAVELAVLLSTASGGCTPPACCMLHNGVACLMVFECHAFDSGGSRDGARASTGACAHAAAGTAAAAAASPESTPESQALTGLLQPVLHLLSAAAFHVLAQRGAAAHAAAQPPPSHPPPASPELLSRRFAEAAGILVELGECAWPLHLRRRVRHAWAWRARTHGTRTRSPGTWLTSRLCWVPPRLCASANEPCSV
jgi:hypothetical protein